MLNRHPFPLDEQKCHLPIFCKPLILKLCASAQKSGMGASSCFLPREPLGSRDAGGRVRIRFSQGNRIYTFCHAMSWEKRNCIVGAGLVPARNGATTRIAPTGFPHVTSARNYDPAKTWRFSWLQGQMRLPCRFSPLSPRGLRFTHKSTIISPKYFSLLIRRSCRLVSSDCSAGLAPCPSPSLRGAPSGATWQSRIVKNRAQRAFLKDYKKYIRYAHGLRRWIAASWLRDFAATPLLAMTDWSATGWIERNPAPASFTKGGNSPMTLFPNSFCQLLGFAVGLSQSIHCMSGTIAFTLNAGFRMAQPSLRASCWR